MKIIAGQYKGRNFYMPKEIRPTQDVMRKSLFDILGQDLTGLVFLDLFAGSGAIGLEAFSRGAEKVVCVEKDPKCVQVIEENVGLLNRVGDKREITDFEVIQHDAFAGIKLLTKQGRKFDLIFADPPYGSEMAKKTLKTLDGYDIVHPNSIVVIQHEEKEILPEQSGRFCCFRERKFGTTILSFYQ